MDLKNNRITVGELLDHAAARAVLQRRFPEAMKHPLLTAARKMTLEKLIAFAGGYVSQEAIREALRELQQI